MTATTTRSPRRRAGRVATAGAALAAIWLTGCDASPTAAPSATNDTDIVSPAPVATIPLLDTTRGLTLPTDRYRPTADEQRLVADAIQSVVTRCMSQFGLAWHVPAAHPPQTHQIDRMYGVGDLETARRYGYHPPPTAGQPLGGRPSTTRSPTAAESLALTGGTDTSSTYQGRRIPVGGCGGEAHRLVTGSDDIDPTHLTDTITVAMWERSKSDPRVAAVVKAWSACMHTAGYRYASPLDAGNDHPDWQSAPTAGTDEIRTAVTDVECKRTTNLIGVWFTVQTAYEQAAIAPRVAELTRIREQWKQAARHPATTNR